MGQPICIHWVIGYWLTQPRSSHFFFNFTALRHSTSTYLYTALSCALHHQALHSPVLHTPFRSLLCLSVSLSRRWRIFTLGVLNHIYQSQGIHAFSGPTTLHSEQNAFEQLYAPLGLPTPRLCIFTAYFTFPTPVFHCHQCVCFFTHSGATPVRASTTFSQLPCFTWH